jgi:hypothetical protein
MAGLCPETGRDRDERAGNADGQVPARHELERRRARLAAAVRARLQEATDWALDIAKHFAGEIDEDVEAIERTRGGSRSVVSTST